MPITTKAGPMPTHQRLRTDDGEDVQDRREPSVELDEKPTVGVRQPRPALHLAPQYDQLLPERCILRLKSALRLEWRSQDAQHKEDQRYHAARIADSLTPPTRMRFSAHTSLLGNVTRVGVHDRTLIAGHADRGDHRRYIGNPGEDHLGAFRREVNRCRDNAGCGADRLLDAFLAGLAGH